MKTSNESVLQPHLTPAQGQAFVRDGFLVMRALANAERIAAMRTLALDHLTRGVEPIEYETDIAYFGASSPRQAEIGDTTRRLLEAYDRDPVFAEWAADMRVTAIVAQLLDSPDVWFTPNHHNCVMTKAPDLSTATGWHRDLRYWSFQTPHLVNAWLALGDEDTDNGCLRLLPGSHQLSVADERMDADRCLRDDHPDNKPLIDSAVEARLSPGDVLFFDAGVFHAAGTNTTDERKLAVVTSYFGRDNAPISGTRSARRPAIHVREAFHA